MHTDALIIGGGLSGLYLAYKLSQKNRNFVLLEARSRFGGRVHAHPVETAAPARTEYYDLGPSWIWPQLQPLMSRLLSTLQLQSFPQFSQGGMLYEQQTEVHQYSGQSAHAQSFRIRGGNTQLITALLQQLDSNSLRLQSKVCAIRRQDEYMQVDVQSGQQETDTIHARRVVLALPPRLIAEHIRIADMDAAVIEHWRGTPTWMAGHAKILFIYDRPFWREQGLSGEVFSQRGPLSEIYDASPAQGGPYALFGFSLLSAHIREQLGRQAFIDACSAQLQSLFPGIVPEPQEVVCMDWSQDEYTATTDDKMLMMHHPDYGLRNTQKSFFDQRLILAGSEVAAQHGGYLEGALEAAEHALTILDATA